MAHPHKDQAKAGHAEKLRKYVDAVPVPTDQWSRAERISGSKPHTAMNKPPNEAVPQFIEDRGLRDVPYGSIPSNSDDD